MEMLLIGAILMRFSGGYLYHLEEIWREAGSTLNLRHEFAYIQRLRRMSYLRIFFYVTTSEQSISRTRYEGFVARRGAPGKRISVHFRPRSTGRGPTQGFGRHGEVERLARTFLRFAKNRVMDHKVRCYDSLRRQRDSACVPRWPCAPWSLPARRAQIIALCNSC